MSASSTRLTRRSANRRPGRRALARIFALPGGFRLLVGRDLGDRARIGAVMVHAMAVSLVFFAALAALGALFVARRVLRRIDAMNSSARAIMAGDLTLRLPVSGSGDELDRLAAGLNDMLARIAELMTGLREVSDNIAHDLRTPLTRLRNHAEAALRSADDPAAYRAALERTIEELDGLIRVFNALLAIARAEAGADFAGIGAFDLGEAVESVAELYAPVAEENGAALKVEAARGLIGRRQPRADRPGGRQSDRQCGQARRAGGRGRRRRRRSRSSRGATARRSAIEVADHGPGIPADDRARALERFVRLEGARSRPGSGLGLSLVAAVMHMHGGALRARRQQPRAQGDSDPAGGGGGARACPPHRRRRERRLWRAPARRAATRRAGDGAQAARIAVARPTRAKCLRRSPRARRRARCCSGSPTTRFFSGR